MESLARLRSRSCIIHGEAVAYDDNGVASFDLVRHHRANLFANSSTDNSEDNPGVGLYEGAGLVGCAKAMKEVESPHVKLAMAMT